MVAAASRQRGATAFQRMLRDRPPALAAVLVVALVVVGCGSLPGSSSTSTGWTWPAPLPRPSDAVAVLIDVEPRPDPVLPDVSYDACPTALLAPMTPEHNAQDTERPVHYRLVEGGQEIRVVWQQGFQAWLRPGLEIVAPDGRVVAAEGLVSSDIGGGYVGPEGSGAFHACFPEYGPRQVSP